MTIDIESFVFLGWLAVGGGLLNTLGDRLMLGFPVAGRDLKMEMLATKPAKAVRIGVYVAMIAIPVWLGVVFPVAYLLRDAPAVLVALSLLGITITTVYSLVYHVSYIFYDIAYRHAPDAVDVFLKEKTFQKTFFFPAGLIMYLSLLAGGILSNAPWWWLAANPFITQTVFTYASRFAPAPIGGYLLAGAGSLGFTAFAFVTMLAVSL